MVKKPLTLNRKAAFSPIEVIIFIGVILIVLGIGQYIYKNRHKQNSTNSNASQTQSNSTATIDTNSTAPAAVEWENALLKYEKIKLKYPSTWNYSDTSISNQDKIKLTSPAGLIINISTGNSEVSGFCASCKLVKAEPVTVLGQAVFLNFISTVNEKDPNKIQLSFNDACAGTCGVEGKNITVNGKKTIVTAEVYYLKNSSSNELLTKPLATYQNDNDWLVAKEIIKSFGY